MVPFIGDNPLAYERFSVDMFKILSLISVFPIPPYEIHSTFVVPIHIISSITNGSHSYLDP